MVDHVSRIFGIDFIYFDLILVAIWITLLIVRRRYKELCFGLFGYGVVHFTDAVIWLMIKETRHIEIDPPVMGPQQFLAYFSFTYGMIMFSFATLMFNKKIHYIEKLLWAALMFGGWLAIGLISQNVQLYSGGDPVFDIYRDMGDSRLGQILMVAIGYLVLIIWKILSEVTDKYPFNLMKEVKWWYFGILILIGIYIHFSMEMTLSIAQIRPNVFDNWRTFLLNIFIEFNTGIPILFALWITFNQKDYKPTIIEDAIDEPIVELEMPIKPQSDQ